MSDNPQYGPAAPFALPAIRCLRLVGGDSVAFAQSQFMNDVAALAPGRFQWNGWLSPKGRVQALFALARIDDGTLCLVGHFDAEALAAALARFVFRSRVKIAPWASVAASGMLAAPAVASGAALGIGGDGPIEFDLSGTAGARTLVLSEDASDASTASGDTERVDAWYALGLAHGWPSLPGVDLEAWTPQQLSLERLGAFSVRKGCYPGQEIVARTHFLGRAKRGLVLLDVDGARAGDPVRFDDGVEGVVAAATATRALAVCPTEHGAAVDVAGRPAAALPLADGLQR